MIFACSNDPENLVIDSSLPEDIAGLLSEGNQLALATDEEVRSVFNGCTC
jgi:hypothetical protein